MESGNKSLGLRPHNMNKTTKKSHDQIGTKETIENIQNIARDWDKMYPDNPLEIGDISLPGGVDTTDHDGHENGKIVDVKLIGSNKMK